MRTTRTVAFVILLLALSGCASNRLPDNAWVPSQSRPSPEELGVKVYTGPCFCIRGEIVNEGRYPLPDGMTLLQAIATAGGFTGSARSKAELISGNQTRVFRLDAIESGKTVDPLLRDGDIIVVKKRWL